LCKPLTWQCKWRVICGEKRQMNLSLFFKKPTEALPTWWRSCKKRASSPKAKLEEWEERPANKHLDNPASNLLHSY
jgi:hypothetical protein